MDARSASACGRHPRAASSRLDIPPVHDRPASRPASGTFLRPKSDGPGCPASTNGVDCCRYRPSSHPRLASTVEIRRILSFGSRSVPFASSVRQASPSKRASPSSPGSLPLPDSEHCVAAASGDRFDLPRTKTRTATTVFPANDLDLAPNVFHLPIPGVRPASTGQSGDWPASAALRVRPFDPRAVWTSAVDTVNVDSSSRA